MKLTSPTLFFATAIATIGVAKATPLAIDSFLTGAPNYTLGDNNLIGQGPAVSGFNGNWLGAYGGAAGPDVVASGLDVTGANAAGGSVTYDSNGRCGRLLSVAYNDTSETTLYVGVMLQLATTGAGYRAFEMHNGGFDDGGNRVLQIATGEAAGGTADTAADFALRVNNNDGISANLGLQDTAVNFFVLRVDLSSAAGADSITVYRNPADLMTEANNTGTTLSGYDFRFDRISLARFGDDNLSFDELRVGTTFRDVTETTNPDSDGDDMDDAWEIANGLTVGIDDSAGDALFDDDGLTNLEEFENGTNPNLADSDGDDIDDKPEIDGTGNAFDGRSTLPNNADSDGDGLEDGDEVSLANGFITDPNEADTDNDDESDLIEIEEGTNPLVMAESSAALGRVIVDGRRDSLYGAAIEVQTVETGFGDNESELNAAYATVIGGQLYLLLTGNIQANFNKLHVLIDSEAGGSQTFNSAGNDDAGRMDGLVFDSAFTPDYHLIVRRGNGDKFDFDFAKLATDEWAFFGSVFGTSTEGRTKATGLPTQSTFAVDPGSFGIGYDDSNTAGVGGTNGIAADPVAAAAVTTGLELCIDLADLGSPTGELRVCPFIASPDHSVLSNQNLGGLPVGTDNLGDPAGVDLSTFAGDQFFTVPLPPAFPDIIDVRALTGSAQLEVEFTSTPGTLYRIDSSSDLVVWDDQTDNFPASAGATSTFTMDADYSPGSALFIRVAPSND